MKLTAQQNKLVEKNVGLVGKVIKDKVHGVNTMYFYSYDDLFQIGCIGLCKAAASDNGKYNFSTYAYRLIWNEICDALVYASRRNCPEILLLEHETQPTDGKTAQLELKLSLTEILNRAKQEASPSVQKGIDALIRMSSGESAKEIGDKWDVSANYVTAWVSKARKFLRARSDMMQLKSELR